MSRTIRRKNRATPKGYYIKWEGTYTREVDEEWATKHFGSVKKLHKLFHSDSWWKMGPCLIYDDGE